MQWNIIVKLRHALLSPTQCINLDTQASPYSSQVDCTEYLTNTGSFKGTRNVRTPCLKSRTMSEDFILNNLWTLGARKSLVLITASGEQVKGAKSRQNSEISSFAILVSLNYERLRSLRCEIRNHIPHLLDFNHFLFIFPFVITPVSFLFFFFGFLSLYLRFAMYLYPSNIG